MPTSSVQLREAAPLPLPSKAHAAMRTTDTSAAVALIVTIAAAQMKTLWVSLLWTAAWTAERPVVLAAN